MKRKKIDFNAEDLVSSVEALARHAAGKEKLTLRLRLRLRIRYPNRGEWRHHPGRWLRRRIGWPVGLWRQKPRTICAIAGWSRWPGFCRTWTGWDMSRICST